MKEFAYNTGSPIYGTDQIGDLAVGTPNGDYSYTNNPQFWGGADETTSYIISASVPGNDQPTFVTDYLYLDPTRLGNSASLSNGNQTVTQLFGYIQSTLGTRIIEPSDRVMFSVLVSLGDPTTQPDSHFIGFGYGNMNYNGVTPDPYGAFPGNDNLSMGYRSDGTIWYNGNQYASGFQTWGDGDIIDIVIANSNATAWVRVNGGYWDNDPSHDAAATIGGFEIITADNTNPLYPVLCPGFEGTMTIQNTSAYGTPNNFEFLGHETASVCFYGTGNTESEFIFLANRISGQDFPNGNDASTWLTTNGYWNNWSRFGSSGFQWMTMMSIDPGAATGIGQNSITVSITQSNGGMGIESGMYQAATFPEEYGVPFGGNQIRNTSNGVFTATFSHPVLNPLVAFASVGNPSTPVPVDVSLPFTPIFGVATTYQNPELNGTQYNRFIGTEGFNIIRIDGTVDTISFNYNVTEFYCTVCFGFVNQNP